MKIIKNIKVSLFDTYVQIKNIIRDYRNRNSSLNNDIHYEEKIKDIPEYTIVTELPKIDFPKNYKMKVNKDSLISIKNFTESKINDIHYEEKIKDIPEYTIVTELPKVDLPKDYVMKVNKDSLISIKNFTENKIF